MAVLADDHEKPASIIPRRFPASQSIKVQRSGKEPVLIPEPRDKEILDNNSSIIIETTTTASTTQIKGDIELTTITTEKPVAIIDVQQPPALAEIEPAIIHAHQQQPIIPAPVSSMPIFAAPEPVIIPTVVSPPPLPMIRPVPLPPAIMLNRPPYFINNFLPPPPMFFNNQFEARPLPFIPDPDFLPMFPPNNGFIPQFDYIPYRPMINRPFGPYGNGPMGTPLIRPWPPAFGGYRPQHGMGYFTGQNYHGVWRY